MVKEYREQNEGECSFCFESNLVSSRFSCNHLICSKCLYRHIFCNHIESVQKGAASITVKCRCVNYGFIDLDMIQLHDLIVSLVDNEDDENFGNCKYHTNENILDYFCKECNKKICRSCYSKVNEKHYGHRVEEQKTLKRKMREYLLDFLQGLENEEVFKMMINGFGEKIRRVVEQDFKATMNHIKLLIEYIQQFQRDYVINYKKEMSKIVYNIKVLNLFYSRFYSDIKDVNKGDIYFLKYINNINSLFIGFELNHHSKVDQTLTEIKGKVEKLKEESQLLNTQFIFKKVPQTYKMVGLVPTQHTRLIKAIIQLSNDYLVTGGEDQQLLVWKEKEEGFINVIMQNRVVGIINALLPLKGMRFAAAGSKQIKIWQVSKKNCDCKQLLIGHDDDVTTLTMLKDQRMISGGKDKKFIVWNEVNEEFEQLQSFCESNIIFNIISLYDSRLIISTQKDINLWKEDNKKFKLMQTFDKPTIKSDLVKTICQLKDGKLAIGGKLGFLYIWEEKKTNVFSCKQVSKEKHEADINAVIELKDGNLATASTDRTVRIWQKDINYKYVQIEVINQYQHGIYCLIQSKDGSLCTTTTMNNFVLYKDRSDYY